MEQAKKSNLIIIGPFPPPIHGESNALQALYHSDALHQKFKVRKINTNRKNIQHPGKFSLKKVLMDVRSIVYVTFLSIFLNNPILYISISQTKLGLSRDCLIIYLCKLVGQCKVITHLHGNNLGNTIDRTKGMNHKFICHSMKKIDVGIVLGEKLSNNYRNLVKNIKVVSNGVPTNFIDRDSINFNKKNNLFSILYLSNLMIEKGYIDLVNAVYLLIQEDYPIKLDLVGGIKDQHEFQLVEQFILDNRLSDRIIYHGIKQNQEKRELFLKADVMVLPTKYEVEGQPISIIEGMAAGLPIISTDKGVIAELIEPCGIIISPEVKEIKESILQLYLNEEKRKRLGVQSRVNYEKYYTEEKYIESLLTIFSENNMNLVFKQNELLGR